MQTRGKSFISAFGMRWTKPKRVYVSAISVIIDQLAIDRSEVKANNK